MSVTTTRAGQPVVAFDIDKRRIAELRKGRDRTGAHFGKFDMVLTTYGTLRRDALEFKDQTFDAVWLSGKHKELIANIDVSKCPRCRYDNFNRIAAEAFEQDGMHRDFL